MHFAAKLIAAPIIGCKEKAAADDFDVKTTDCCKDYFLEVYHFSQFIFCGLMAGSHIKES